MERSKKQVKRRFLYSLPMILILIGVLALSVRGTWSMYGRFVEARDAAKEANRELVELEERKAYLGAKISELETPEGLDREIRARFNVKKEGEEVVVITGKIEPKELPPKRSFTGSVILWFENLFQ